MHKLSNTTIRLISSSQVITSVYAAVKELVENAIDAQATSIEVRLDNFGLKRIEVVDNGHGIPDGQEEFIAKPHFTSKLKDHNDLSTLSTFGFRGEALHSLCTVSNLSFSTKTENQPVGKLFTLDRNGNITDKKPCTRQNGATIISENLFKNLPVRKQFYSGSKKGKDELKKVQDLLNAYGLILPEIRITLKHNQSVIWQKVKSSSLKDTFISVFGISCYREMQQGTFENEDYNLKVVYILPNCNANEEICRKSNDRIFMSINKRPVMLKNICQVVKSCCNEFVPVLQNRYPVAYLAIDLPTSYLDVNVEPNKSMVLMENMKEIQDIIESNISSIYKEQSTQVLSKDDGSKSFGMDRCGYEALPTESDLSDVCSAKGDSQNQEKNEHIRSSGKCNEDFNSCDMLSTTDSLDLAGKPYKAPAPQNMDKKQLDSSDDIDEGFVQVEVNSMSPGLGQSRTENQSIQKDISHEKSVFCWDAEENSSSNENPQSIRIGSAQFKEANRCLGNRSPNISALADGKNDTSGVELETNKELNEDTGFLVGNGQRNALRGLSFEEVRNSDEKSKKDRSSTSAFQMSVDEWSRGTGIVDKNNGEPLQPFRILEPDESRIPKKQCGRKRKKQEKSEINSNAGFVQTTLSKTFPEESVIKFDFNDVKQHLEDDELCVSNKDAVDVIGEISPWKSWVIRLKNELYFFNPFRAYERDLFNELMKSHVLPSNLLSKTILVTESMMKKGSSHGRRNWLFFQSMPFERVTPTNGRCLVDDRFTSNGIEIRKRKDAGSNEMIFEIFKLCTEIKEYGIMDLNEIIDRIYERPGNENMSSFEEYRPKKVVHYLQRETARLVRSSTTVFTKDEINDLALKVLSGNEQYDNILCLHERRVFANLDIVPL